MLFNCSIRTIINKIPTIINSLINQLRTVFNCIY
nr:MAG TPA: hypothetical protein [Caudoviricetes sp.]